MYMYSTCIYSICTCLSIRSLNISVDGAYHFMTYSIGRSTPLIQIYNTIALILINTKYMNKPSFNMSMKNSNINLY